MKFLKNRLVAAILLAIVVCVSTATSAEEDLDDMAWDTAHEFYYTDSGSKSIYERLETRNDAANGLVSIAEQYDLATETEALKFAYREMADLIDHWSDPEDFYRANERLNEPFNTLYRALMEEALSDSDRKAVESYHTAFEGAQKMINESDYNDKVRQFYNEVSGFPSHLFMELFDIDEPEYYAADGDHFSDTQPVTDPETAAENFGESLGSFISETVESSIEGALDSLND